MGLNGRTSTPGKPYEAFDGQILMSIMPYNTFKLRVVYQRLEADQAIEDWDSAKSAFALVIGSMIGCELLVDEAELSDQARGFWYFWAHQTGETLADYDLFITYIAMESLDEFFAAFKATRSVLPQADEALHGGKPDATLDPLASSAGGKSGKET